MQPNGLHGFTWAPYSHTFLSHCPEQGPLALPAAPLHNLLLFLESPPSRPAQPSCWLLLRPPCSPFSGLHGLCSPGPAHLSNSAQRDSASPWNWGPRCNRDQLQQGPRCHPCTPAGGWPDTGLLPILTGVGAARQPHSAPYAPSPCVTILSLC